MTHDEFKEWLKDEVTISGALSIEIPDKEYDRIINKELKAVYELSPEAVKESYTIIPVEYFYREELTINSSDKGNGKTFNRLCNNVWCRNLVINKLKMLSNIHGYFITEVNPAYSSFIGNILYGNESTPDMIASSIEVARRAYNKFKKGHFYPPIQLDHLNEQWKQTLNGLNNWKEMFNKVKKLKWKYRFLLLDYIQNAVFSKTYIKQKVTLYTF